MYCNIIELKLTGHPVIIYFMHAAPEEAAHRERHRVRGVPRGERHQLLAGLHQEPLPPHLHRRQVSQSLSVSLFCSQFCHIRFRGRVFLKFRWLPKRSRWRNTRKTSSTARLVSYQRERERERERERDNISVPSTFPQLRKLRCFPPCYDFLFFPSIFLGSELYGSCGYSQCVPFDLFTVWYIRCCSENKLHHEV